MSSNPTKLKPKTVYGSQCGTLPSPHQFYGSMSRMLKFLKSLRKESTEPEKMAHGWFSEVPSCCSLPLLLGPAWVLLKYVLQTIFSGPVYKSEKIFLQLFSSKYVILFRIWRIFFRKKPSEIRIASRDRQLESRRFVLPLLHLSTLF